MPLPSGDIAWPPGGSRGPLADLREWAAWYSGDTEQLTSVYGSRGEVSATRRQAGGYQGLRSRFWGRRGENTPGARQRIHVPIASDIAATSADLLFGEEPRIRIREATAERPDAEAVAAQDRLIEIADLVGLSNVLLEGAEICSAIGGVYLKPGWNEELAPFPLLDVIHGDAAVGEFIGDLLQAVTFWKVLLRDNSTVYRLLERHENGRILNGLYVGNETSLGTKVDLNRHPESAELDEEIVIPEAVLRGRATMVQYVPNVRPNRHHRHLPIGRADYSGCEQLMDSLDETYTSWMRDIRLGQARIVVSEDALTRRGRGEGAQFDYDQEVFTALNMDPSTKASGPITPVQFDIRTEQHMSTVTHLLEQIVTMSGYSPQTFGLHIEGRAESGTALRVREGKTLKTRGRKARYWMPAVESTLETMLAIDSVILGNPHGIYRPSVDVADVAVANPIEVAQSVSMFRSAQAMSMETGIRLAQPDLDDAGVNAEVARILDETTAVGDPTGGFLG